MSRSGIKLSGTILVLGILAFIHKSSAAVYQWSAPVGGDNRRMVLWIPDNCQRIRGLIWCADNLTESNIVESPVFRKVCEEERIGIIRSIPDYGRHKEGLRPALSAAWGWGDGLSVEDKKEYDRCEQGLRKPDSEVSKEEKAEMRETLRKFRTGLQDRCEGELNAILKKMAEVSGYPEVEHAPVLFLGHSMCGLLCWFGPFFIPERVWGSLPVKTGSRGMAPEERPELRMDGVPLLYFNQIPVEGTETGRVPSTGDGGIENGRKNGYLVGRVFDWGGSHFDINEEMIDVMAMFVKKASKFRLSDEIPDGAYPKLKALTQEMGYLALPVIADSDIPGAPYNEFTGDKTKACWFFDKEMADKAAAHFIEHRLRKRHGITIASNGTVIQPYTANFGAAGIPIESGLDDGWTFKLTGEHLDYFTGEYPKDKQPAGKPESGKFDVKLLGRTNLARIGEDLYRYRRYNAGEDGHGWLAISHTGDKDYARMNYACTIWLTGKSDKGVPQTITFPEIPNILKETKEIELKATSDVPGQVVEYNVVSGPAELVSNDPKFTGSTLRLTPIPPGAKYPVKVIVSAYQLGRLKEPLVQNAKEVTREFSICESPRQLQEITQAAESARQLEIAREQMNVTLGAAQGTIVGGQGAKLDSVAGTIGWWSDEQTSVTWTADVPADCGYRVMLDYALADDADGTEVAIEIGRETVHAKLKATGSWGNYQEVEVGRIPPGKGAGIPVSLNCTKKTGGFIMNLRGLKLIASPVKEPQSENAP